LQNKKKLIFIILIMLIFLEQNHIKIIMLQMIGLIEFV